MTGTGIGREFPLLALLARRWLFFFLRAHFGKFLNFSQQKISVRQQVLMAFFFSKPAKNIAKNQKKLKKNCNVFIILANKNCWLANKISWLFFLLKNSKKKCFLEKYLPTPFANFVGPAMAFFFSRQQRDFPTPGKSSSRVLCHYSHLCLPIK